MLRKVEGARSREAELALKSSPGSPSPGGLLLTALTPSLPRTEAVLARAPGLGGGVALGTRITGWLIAFEYGMARCLLSGWPL